MEICAMAQRITLLYKSKAFIQAQVIQWSYQIGIGHQLAIIMKLLQHSDLKR
jgi:hypothetical protein